MAQVVIGGTHEIGLMAFGQQHPGTVQFLQQQITQVPSQILTEAGKQFYADVGRIYDQFNNADALRAAKAAIRKVEGIFNPDAIRPLTELVELQQASVQLQRWIMAEPTVRALYHQQRVDGYSESYVDMEPGLIGRDHYDYRRATNGLVQDVEGDPECDWKVTHYFDVLHEGDRERTLDEKMDIQTCWDAVRLHLQRGKDDPVSSVGGQL